MINPNLSTKNSVLLALNEKFPVMTWIGNNAEGRHKFVVYEPLSIDWKDVTIDKLMYLCDVKTNPKNNTYVIWNDKKYTDVNALMRDVNKFNATREFPAYTYNPQYIESWQNSSKLHWFLTEKLNMKYNNSCYYVDDSRSKIFDVNVEFAFSENEANTALYHIFGETLYQSFSDISEVCKQITSLYTAAIASQIATAAELEKNIPADIELGDISAIKTFNKSTWNFDSAKNILISRLETILKKLKED